MELAINFKTAKKKFRWEWIGIVCFCFIKNLWLFQKKKKRTVSLWSMLTYVWIWFYEQQKKNYNETMVVESNEFVCHDLKFQLINFSQLPWMKLTFPFKCGKGPKIKRKNSWEREEKKPFWLRWDRIAFIKSMRDHWKKKNKLNQNMCVACPTNPSIVNVGNMCKWEPCNSQMEAKDIM